MSYLVDALRKAERERNLGRVPDLAYATHDREPAGNSRLPGWLIGVIALLVVVNVLVLVAFWWTGQGDGGAASNKGNNQAVPANEVSQPANSKSSKLPQAPTPAPTSPPAEASPPSKAPSEAPASESPARLPNQQPDTAATPQEPIFAAPPPQPRVNLETPEFEQPPPQDIPHINALAQSERAKLPELRVNGHLYSSIPGRSFVLINGRRYHEGQRLPEGPAIVLIDEEGAIFNYLDTRFRLDAPR